MMIQTDFPLIRRSFKSCLSIIAVLAIVFGCGGGGSGGSDADGDGSITPISNQIPTAEIFAPTGTYFNEGENITFSGSGTDDEDGELNGGSLVWTSNIDGTLGTGSTVITNALTAGDHEITLAVTDSAGQTYITDPALQIHIEKTRFIKMGSLTSGVIDASNAFDGDNLTAATIVMPNTDSDFLHFKAYVGTEDTFLFKIKLGGTAVSGLSLSIEGLATDGFWQPISIIFLFADTIVTTKITDAQTYKDAEGYINLRARASYDTEYDDVTLYEIWRIDPIYAGPDTQNVTNPEAAFDGSPSSPATIATPWNPLVDPQDNRNLLHFKAYVGTGISDTFTFNLLLNDLGSQNFFTVEVEDLTTPDLDDWELITSLDLNDTSTRTITVSNVQDYTDEKGYISLRGSWTTVDQGTPADSVKIYEIWRNDLFLVGPKTTNDGSIFSPESTVDGNDASFGTIYYFWGEFGHYDFLHVQAYVADPSDFSFSIMAEASAPDAVADLIVDGEHEPDHWSEIERIGLDSLSTTTINLLNGRQYIDADGFLSLRVRWESGSLVHDANVYEIKRIWVWP
jgi:hypothetical protein